MSAFTDKPLKKPEKIPLDLVECQDCTLLQLKHTAPFNEMYVKQYWYKSNVNPVIVRDLKQIVRTALKMARPKRGDVFLDLGANDGTLLKYVPRRFNRIGVEPASNLIDELVRNCDTAVSGFWGEGRARETVEDITGGNKAKVITAIGMFYDSENPNAFMKDVKAMLAPDGLFIAQMMTLWPMIVNADIGNVCHEHLEFYSYKSLKRLFEQNGLEIFKIEQNGINGGSYRLYARHLSKGSVKFCEVKPNYKSWIRRIEANREKTERFIRIAVEQGKKVYVYGASTKSSTILQWYGLNAKLITAAADRNPAKWGKFQSATNIPIVSEEEARLHADYFLVMPYGFREHFMKREAKWRRRGGKFIFCMPQFEVI